MTKVRKLFDLRGEVPQNEVPFFITAGAAVVLVLWQLLCSLGISKNILPTPFSVLKAIPELFFEEHLMTDIAYSVRLNIFGYLEACALAIPLGMAIGMFPLFREMFKKHIDSVRFLPITALTGIFIFWFGIGNNMKVFIPSVLSELFDDIRVLVAISWTYIIIAEMLNMNRGVGAALYE